MPTEKEMINELVATDLPTALLKLIYEYNDETRILMQSICYDIKFLLKMPSRDISTRSIWENIPVLPRQSYIMTPVKLRINYINMIPSRTCLYCYTFPSFTAYLQNYNVGFGWGHIGCNWCCGQGPDDSDFDFGVDIDYYGDEY
jgi:hypothetical protein